MSGFQGNPCWYELGTTDPAAAGRFYAEVLGWAVSDSGMEGMVYLLARAGEEMVAGLTSNAGQAGAPPPNWLTYFAADDCDATAAAAEAAGGRVLVAPADIPGTGRFAVVADPQGAVFGLLEPDMSRMTEAQRKKALTTGAFDPDKTGHGAWNELMSSDPAAAEGFYAGLFGWTKARTLDMGEAGTYRILSHKGRDIGAVMGMGNAPVPAWLPYFGADPVRAAMARIEAAGGTVHHGPHEVPGGMHIAVATDPQGAWFAVVGPLD